LERTNVKRTTILADDQLLLDVKQLAARQGKTVTAIVQEALSAYLEANRPSRPLSFIGIGHSGNPQLAEGADAALRAEIDAIEGWSPRRKAG
jgi:hypothetical protein